MVGSRAALDGSGGRNAAGTRCAVCGSAVVALAEPSAEALSAPGFPRTWRLGGSPHRLVGAGVAWAKSCAALGRR